MFFQAPFGHKEDSDVSGNYQQQWNDKESKGVEDGHIFPACELLQQRVKNGKQP